MVVAWLELELRFRVGLGVFGFQKSVCFYFVDGSLSLLGDDPRRDEHPPGLADRHNAGGRVHGAAPVAHHAGMRCSGQ
jgi:hypothetical protein